MAKQTLRRKKHKKSRRLQRKSHGLQCKSLGLQRKSLGLQRKSLGLQRKSLGLQRKSRRLQRKSRIQRGGRIPTRLELYTALMLELLGEVYSRDGLHDSQLIKYIKNFFGNPRNFIKCIKARMVQEIENGHSLGEFITQIIITSPSTQSKYNDSEFALSNFKLDQQQKKWIDFIISLQETIDNMFNSNLDIAVDVLGYDLTNPVDIKYLRDYIKKLKEGDGLGRNALDKALNRMIQWQKDETTGKPIPSPFLKDIIAQVEYDYPIAAAEINKPELKTNTRILNFGEVLAITPSFESDSATLYVTIPNGRTMIVNSDVDESAKNVQGGLKQIHKQQFNYTCEQLPAGDYTFQLIEYPNTHHTSDPLRIKVVCAAPAEAGAVVSSRPAETETATEAGAARPDPITVPKKTNRNTWFKNPATYQTKIQTNCEILNRILPKYTRRDTLYHQQRVNFLCNFAKNINNIELLISIHDELKNIKTEYIS